MDKNDTPKIALAFSGGGYRAASFSLGVLTYLELVKINNTNLLNCVYVLSTVSGGTVTGIRYTQGIKRGESLQAIYDALYSMMSEKDLVGLALERLTSDKGWNKERVKSLISAVADVYNGHLFNEGLFGAVMSEENPIHLKHISFNATEFANAQQFRFQWSEKLIKPKTGEPERGIIGNYYYDIPFEVAKDIRLGDILAASSCFPGGFEPINFPTDFVFPATTDWKQFQSGDAYPVGLMDGGIVDNQGIVPLLLAETRIKRNLVDAGEDTSPDHALDLLIVSDVTSPYMDDYKASVQKPLNWWRRLTPAGIYVLNTVVLLLSAFSVYYFLKHGKYFWSTVLTIIGTLAVVLFLLGRLLVSLPRKFKVPGAFLKPLGKLLRLRLQVYENLIVNRANSVLAMTGDVFLKHMRSLNYKAVFEEPSWQNRRIMNAIYELREGEEKLKDKIRNGEISAELIPSEKLQKVATRATSMGTTLWYTKEELSKDNEQRATMLDTVIACGQFTMCWNLLEYLRRIKKDGININEKHKKLLECEGQLMDHWRKFKGDPFWLVKQYKPEKVKS